MGMEGRSLGKQKMGGIICGKGGIESVEEAKQKAVQSLSYRRRTKGCERGGEMNDEWEGTNERGGMGSEGRRATLKRKRVAGGR